MSPADSPKPRPDAVLLRLRPGDREIIAEGQARDEFQSMNDWLLHVVRAHVRKGRKAKATV